MSIWSKRLNITLAALGLAIASAAFAQEPVVVREGEGQHRRDCDKLELKPGWKIVDGARAGDVRAVHE